MSSRNHNRGTFLLSSAISAVMGIAITVTLLEKVVDPHSALGDWIFWPQHHVSFLNFGRNGPIAPRLMFLAVILVVSSLVLVGGWLSGLYKTSFMRGAAYGIFAVAAPMFSWLIVRPIDLLAALGLMITLVFAWHITLFRRNERFSRTIWYVEVLIWLGWWGYLFHLKLDLIMLLVPLFSAAAVFIWTQHVLRERERFAP
jgi:hypothetical protein